MKIALLGAESTGKTTLAGQFGAHLRREGHAVAVVPEWLREWCTRERRAPRPDECLAIGQEQERRVDAADAGIVVADTTALMVAVWGGLLFPDHPLLRFALACQRSYDLTLVMGLDLPWVADGQQRDPSWPREHTDAMLRELLERGGIGYRVVYGSGDERLRNALAALPGGLAPPAPVARAAWRWQCDSCGDPDCEHRLFRSLARN